MPATINKGMFTSSSPLWATPQAFFDVLNGEFGFTLDVAADPTNAKCKRYFTETEDGLSREWRGVVWCNPPYGREIGTWVQKAAESAASGSATVVCLVPARTDAEWWHRYAMRAAEIRLVKGRLRFGGSQVNAPFPSAVLVFRPGESGRCGPVFRAMPNHR